MSATASEKEENLCEVFDEKLAEDYLLCLSRSEETAPYSANIIAFRTLNYLDWEKYAIEDDYYRYPADVFEALANRLFNVEVDLKTVDDDRSSTHIFYNTETGTYDVRLAWSGGGFAGEYPVIEGYVKNADNTYDVYWSNEWEFYEQEEVDAYLKEIGTTKEELGDKYREETDGEYTLYYIKVKLAKIHVSYDGEYVKIISHEKLEDIPPVEGMITPIEKPAETPKVDYDAPDEVKIEGDTAFEEGTVVKVESVSKGEIYERAEKSLSDIAIKDKITVFEFSATKDNATVQPNGKVKVSFELPSNLSADNLKMYYVAEDGKTEEIKITVDKDTKTVSAELEHFSTYVLCNVQPANSGNGNNNTDNGINSPQTGDNSNLVLGFALLVLAGAGLVGAGLYSRKEKHQR